MIKQCVAAAALVASVGAYAQQQLPQGPQGEKPSVEQMRGPGGPGGAGLSRADFMQRAAQHFSEMDANNDGAVSPDERRAFHQHRLDERGGHAGPHGGPRNAPPPQDGAQGRPPMPQR